MKGFLSFFLTDSHTDILQVVWEKLFRNTFQTSYWSTLEAGDVVGEDAKEVRTAGNNPFLNFLCQQINESAETFY